MTSVSKETAQLSHSSPRSRRRLQDYTANACNSDKNKSRYWV